MPTIKHLAFIKLALEFSRAYFSCNSKRRCLLVLISTISFLNTLKAQYFPPVSVYESKTYQAGNQNWMIEQDGHGNIFIANNEGLLIYNGTQWQLFTTQRPSILRSVKSIGDKIYTGHNLDFGYWSKEANGTYLFTSLVEKLNIKIEEDEQFWDIIQNDRLIYFQSLSNIYIYDPKFETIKIINQPNGVKEIFKVGNSIFYHSIGNGIYKLENDTPVLFYQEPELLNAAIINMFLSDEGITLLTKENGFYRLKNNVFEKWEIAAKELLEPGDFFSAVLLKNGDFALGTISRGLIIIDKKGQLKYQIDRTKGLNNNTVLSLYEDSSNNLWLGLDNGINCINLASPYREYIDKQGVLGTVYCSIIFEDKLYLGTNQGLFWKSLSSNDDFHFIPNTNGQVWTLFKHHQILFCGHDKGTFAIKNQQADLIAYQAGTWHFVQIPEHPDLLLQGNYNGFHVLKKESTGWKYSHPIHEFEGSAKHFVLLNQKIYINHSSKGLLSLELDEAIKNIVQTQELSQTIPSKNASIALLDQQLFFAGKDGIYQLNKAETQLVKNENLSNFLAKRAHNLNRLVVDNSNKMWLFTERDILHFSQSEEDGTLEVSELAVDKSLLQFMHGYENISALKENFFLLGLTNGYFCINLEQLSRLNKDYEISVNAVFSLSDKQDPNSLDLLQKGNFHYTENSFNFIYNVPQTLKYQPVSYQYQLEGLQDNWSAWSEKNTMQFQNLEFGDYIFHVRAKVGNKLTKNVAQYAFQINRPWYFSKIAIAIYTLLALAIAFIINFFYKKHYQRQEEKLILQNQEKIEFLRLKNEQALIQLKNEQLNAKMDAKNKELAVTTMNLIKKNEFLISIRESLLDKDVDQKKNEQVVKSINKELENEETWKLFKNAFDHVDKDFFKKIKDIHPQLTPNDIKLCTYLRLNLSSKEIAPLLNISVRSMEIKRYRLRKKMQLSHETNLVEYIMSI